MEVLVGFLVELEVVEDFAVLEVFYELFLSNSFLLFQLYLDQLILLSDLGFTLIQWCSFNRSLGLTFLRQ